MLLKVLKDFRKALKLHPKPRANGRKKRGETKPKVH
jgi:hypothetical protein